MVILKAEKMMTINGNRAKTRAQLVKDPESEPPLQDKEKKKELDYHMRREESIKEKQERKKNN